jgi:hypothetical protein
MDRKNLYVRQLLCKQRCNKKVANYQAENINNKMYLCGVCFTLILLSVVNIILRGSINKSLSNNIHYFVNRHENLTDFMSCINISQDWIAQRLPPVGTDVFSLHRTVVKL